MPEGAKIRFVVAPEFPEQIGLRLQEPCKHVIALVLAAIEQIKADHAILSLDVNSELYQVISDGADAFADNEDDDSFDQEERTTESLQDILQKKNKKELLGLILEINQHIAEIGRRIVESEQIKKGCCMKQVEYYLYNAS